MKKHLPNYPTREQIQKALMLDYAFVSDTVMKYYFGMTFKRYKKTHLIVKV